MGPPLPLPLLLGAGEPPRPFGDVGGVVRPLGDPGRGAPPLLPPLPRPLPRPLPGELLPLEDMYTEVDVVNVSQYSGSLLLVVRDVYVGVGKSGQTRAGEV